MNKTKDILEERGKTYGDFVDFSDVSVELRRAILQGLDASGVELSNAQEEAMFMICHKIARIVNGNADHVDSWQDIAGYAELAVRSIETTAK